MNSAQPIAIVTGGGRGIGRGVSLRLASEGYRVLLTYNSDSSSAEQTVDEIRTNGSDAVALKIDCSSPSEILLLSEHPWCKNGIDVLILNHGAYDRISASELTDEILRKSMEINFFGAFGVRVFKHAAPIGFGRMVIFSEINTVLHGLAYLRCVAFGKMHFGLKNHGFTWVDCR